MEQRRKHSVSFFEVPVGWTPPCNGKWADGSGTSDLGNEKCLLILNLICFSLFLFRFFKRIGPTNQLLIMILIRINHMFQ